VIQLARHSEGLGGEVGVSTGRDRRCGLVRAATFLPVEPVTARIPDWFCSSTGAMEWYDLDPATWSDWNDFDIENAQFYEDQAEAAYNDMVGEWGW
jgi:adenylosuccinate synthase